MVLVGRASVVFVGHLTGRPVAPAPWCLFSVERFAGISRSRFWIVPARAGGSVFIGRPGGAEIGGKNLDFFARVDSRWRQQ